ncbi:Serine carboxypeptidase-like 43 [Acorus calamus]|uniref:Serine carboxypeptidase-like 43 n=1 Tax=Acorus calamus TaxID=4465 RepID=A0AAV9EDP3_ACOCL|nr:Serine carboxypeptidase-like 43 [Acorus calamus]
MRLAKTHLKSIMTPDIIGMRDGLQLGISELLVHTQEVIWSAPTAGWIKANTDGSRSDDRAGFVSWRVGGFPVEDLVAKLPRQPDVGFKQFAGYVDHKAEADADNKPLTLWLNGGPGCSSVGGGAFTELGPFFPRGDGRGLLINSNSWNKVSNLLFVESPAGVGWSYSNTTNDYTTGDAATGHYIPQLAEVLLNHNEYSNGPKFNIKGVAIGNPLLRLDRDIPAVYEYFWSHGMISDEIYFTPNGHG